MNVKKGVLVEDKHLFKLFMETIKDTLTADEQICNDYSGRGMYGKECVGVITNDPCAFAFRFGFHLSLDIAKDPTAVGIELKDIRQRGAHLKPIRQFTNMKTDELGLQYILYWPEIRYVRTCVHDFQGQRAEIHDGEECFICDA